MKKIFALMIAVMMIATMSTVAFAGEANYVTGGTIDVSGAFDAADDAAIVISVDIEWDAMEFTYTEGEKGEWNPTDHTYGEDGEGAWSTNTATITVTNHSNTAVNATLTFAADVTGVIGTFTETSGTANDGILAIATAVDTAVDAAPSAEAEFGISGAAIAADADLGVITVAIAAA